MPPRHCRVFCIVLLNLLFIVSAQAEQREPSVDECVDVNACMARLFEVAEPAEAHYLTVSSREWEVARRLSQFGDAAAKELVPLLAQTDIDVAQVAAAALREMDSIDPRYLPDIVAALDSGKDLGWLPVALGKIDDPEAAREAVKRYLKDGDAGGNQISFAVERIGERALPFLIEASLCKNGCPTNRHYLIGYILGEMDTQVRARAARQIIDALSDVALVETRAGMVCMIGNLGKPAINVERDLLQLRRDDPPIRNCTDRALIGIHSEFAGKVFARALGEQPDILILRDLAELKTKGKAAGPAVERLLKSHDHDRELRIGAARTLGYLEYTPAVPTLIKLLNDDSDVVMNLVAAEALASIGGVQADEALREAAAIHWHPYVRQAALPVKKMQDDSEFEEDRNFPMNFFAYQHFSTESCESIRGRMVEESRDTKLYSRYAAKELDRLAYMIETVSFTVEDEAERRSEDKNGVIEIRQDNVKEVREEVRQVPEKGLKVEGGWVVGSDRGEWGGELVFIDNSGQAEMILKANVEDIYRLGKRYIAITGLAHMFSNEGAIYELKVGADGRWYAEFWRSLPGAPSSSYFVETSELFIDTYSGGSILIAADGRMRMAECAK